MPTGLVILSVCTCGVDPPGCWCCRMQPFWKAAGHRLVQRKAPWPRESSPGRVTMDNVEDKDTGAHVHTAQRSRARSSGPERSQASTCSGMAESTRLRPHSRGPITWWSATPQGRGGELQARTLSSLTT